MRHALLVVFLALLCFVPLRVPTAHADSATFDPGPPKGVVGSDGIACTGRATQDGHTLTYTVYIGADADEMRDRPAREQAWQTDYCTWALAQDMGGWFRYQWQTELNPDNIKATVKHL